MWEVVRAARGSVTEVRHLGWWAACQGTPQLNAHACSQACHCEQSERPCMQNLRLQAGMWASGQADLVVHQPNVHACSQLWGVGGRPSSSEEATVNMLLARDGGAVGWLPKPCSARGHACSQEWGRANRRWQVCTQRGHLQGKQ